MRTEEEIRNQIEIYTRLKDKSAIFTSEFELACGAIHALRWVLNEVNNENYKILL